VPDDVEVAGRAGRRRPGAGRHQGEIGARRTQASCDRRAASSHRPFRSLGTVRRACLSGFATHGSARPTTSCRTPVSPHHTSAAAYELQGGGDNEHTGESLWSARGAPRSAARRGTRTPELGARWV